MADRIADPLRKSVAAGADSPEADERLTRLLSQSGGGVSVGVAGGAGGGSTGILRRARGGDTAQEARRRRSRGRADERGDGGGEAAGLNVLRTLRVRFIEPHPEGAERIQPRSAIGFTARGVGPV